jgi:DNA-binding transcriptional ArsR family regulator
MRTLDHLHTSTQRAYCNIPVARSASSDAALAEEPTIGRVLWVKQQVLVCPQSVQRSPAWFIVATAAIVLLSSSGQTQGRRLVPTHKARMSKLMKIGFVFISVVAGRARSIFAGMVNLSKPLHNLLSYSMIGSDAIISLLADMRNPGMQIAISRGAVKAKLFRGLSDHSRLTILEILRDKPLTVSEIVERTGLSQPNVSNHLACLKSCGLVVNAQSGRYVTYRLSNRSVEKLLLVADGLLEQCASSIDTCNHYAQ